MLWAVAVLLDIGEVVRRTGVPVSTLHVWERHGLITPAARSGNRRQYDEADIHRIAVIMFCRRLGLTLAEIAAAMAPDAFADGKQLLEDKLNDLLERRRSLDMAIDCLRHALDCPEPSPLTCRGFTARLEGVLPVRRP